MIYPGHCRENKLRGEEEAKTGALKRSWSSPGGRQQWLGRRGDNGDDGKCLDFECIQEIQPAGRVVGFSVGMRQEKNQSLMIEA